MYLRNLFCSYQFICSMVEVFLHRWWANHNFSQFFIFSIFLYVVDEGSVSNLYWRSTALHAEIFELMLSCVERRFSNQDSEKINSSEIASIKLLQCEFHTLNTLKTHIADKKFFFIRSGNTLVFYCIQLLISHYQKNRLLSKK